MKLEVNINKNLLDHYPWDKRLPWGIFCGNKWEPLLFKNTTDSLGEAFFVQFK